MSRLMHVQRVVSGLCKCCTACDAAPEHTCGLYLGSRAMGPGVKGLSGARLPPPEHSDRARALARAALTDPCRALLRAQSRLCTWCCACVVA